MSEKRQLDWRRRGKIVKWDYGNKNIIKTTISYLWSTKKYKDEVNHEDCFSFFWIVDDETWKNGEELVKKMPKLKTNSRIEWREEGTGKNFVLLCAMQKGNAVPTKELNLFSDEKNEMGLNNYIENIINEKKYR